MKHDDAMILKEIQKNTQMGMTAIDTILDKIGDDEFSLQLSRQSLRYSEIHNRALDQILEQGQPNRGIAVKGKYSCQYSAQHQYRSSGRDDDSGEQQGHYQYVEGTQT